GNGGHVHPDDGLPLWQIVTVIVVAVAVYLWSTRFSNAVNRIRRQDLLQTTQTTIEIEFVQPLKSGAYIRSTGPGVAMEKRGSWVVFQPDNPCHPRIDPRV
ncbi:MAG: hypothetical protein R3268_13030, partial [Acidiferrobacterales bacterium]|nr:hypothetical protein [Acidiferrobacterales bacterium]